MAKKKKPEVEKEIKQHENALAVASVEATDEGKPETGFSPHNGEDLSQIKIIERKQTEERFKIAAESLSDVIYEWDLGDGIEWFGDIDSLMGYEPGKFPRSLEGWGTLLHPDDRDRVMAAIGKQFKEDEPFDVEYRIRKKDGAYAYWIVRGKIVCDPDNGTGRMIGAITDITGRKKAEETLRENESGLRQLTESLPLLFWTCLPEGPCDFLGPQWIEYTGIPEAEQLGYGWLQQLHPDDRERIVAEWSEAVKAGTFFDIMFRIRNKNGEFRWFYTRAIPIRNASGKLLKWYGINIDIHERKRTEAELRDSETKYKILVENIPQKIFMKDRNYRWVSINENFARDLGIRPEDVVGKVDHDLFPKDLADKYHADDVRVMETGQTEEFEEKYVQEDRETWVKTVKTPVRDEKGEIVGVFGIFWDITARKLAEEALLEAKDNLERRVLERTVELAKNKWLLDETGRLARVGGWEIDLKSNKLSWTDMVYQIHEVGSEYRPTVETGINFYAPEAVPVITEAVQRAIEDGQPFDIELPLITAKKNRLWVRAIGQAYRDNGEIVRVGGVFHDITERKLADDELRKHRDHLEELVNDRTEELDRLNAELARKNKELEQVVYVASHDMRSPLVNVQGFSKELGYAIEELAGILK